MQNGLPCFEDAAASFRQFIESQGHCPRLCWIFREDVVERRRRLFVRMPGAESEAEAKRLYDEGVRRGLGVALEVFCFIGWRPLAYVWLPQDEEDASYRMLSGLKMSVPVGEEYRTIVEVRSSLRWMLLRWLESRDGKYKRADQIPRRIKPG